MDTKHLKTFITFSEEKSYLKASMKLNYAPSTLAEHIMSLEHELGVKLVESKGKRSTLTKCGEEFLLYAKKMMDIYKTSLNAMSSLGSIKGNLRVMTVESLGLYSMNQVFAKFMMKYPDVTLSISIGNCNTFYERLKNDEIDIGYLYEMEEVKKPDLLTTVLFKEPLCYMVAPTHYLASKKQVMPEDFQHQIFISAQKECYYYEKLEQMLREHHVVLKSRLELDSGNLIKKYVSSGYGVCLLPYSIVKEEIRQGKLVALDWAGEQLEVYAQVLTLKKEWMLPSIPALIEVSKESIQVDEV